MKNNIILAAVIFAGLSALACFSAGVAPWAEPVKRGVYLGAAVAFFNATATFACLAWALKKSDLVFYAALFGGMLWKLAVLGCVSAILIGSVAWSPAAGLVSLAILTLLSNLVEAGFFRKGTLHGF